MPIVYVPHETIQSLEFDQKLCANFTKLLTSSVMAEWSWPRFDFPAVWDFHAVVQMAGKFKKALFQYWFMYLIFIYYSKRGGDYWRGALVRTNMVHVSKTKQNQKSSVRECYCRYTYCLQCPLACISTSFVLGLASPLTIINFAIFWHPDSILIFNSFKILNNVSAFCRTLNLRKNQIYNKLFSIFQTSFINICYLVLLEVFIVMPSLIMMILDIIKVCFTIKWKVLVESLCILKTACTMLIYGLIFKIKISIENLYSVFLGKIIDWL